MIRSLLAAALLVVPTLASAQEDAVTTHPFTAHGGYHFADTYAITVDDPLIYAQAGRLTGAFRMMFDNGLELRTHVVSATANRVTERGTAIFGTMRIDLGEAEGVDPESNRLFYAYEGDVELRGSVQIVRVSGEFVGGTGRYTGAEGTFSVTSINGFFTDGTGELILAEGNTLPETSTAGTEEMR